MARIISWLALVLGLIFFSLVVFGCSAAPGRLLR
jgi:hypothetical protein